MKLVQKLRASCIHVLDLRTPLIYLFSNYSSEVLSSPFCRDLQLTTDVNYSFLDFIKKVKYEG